MLIIIIGNIDNVYDGFMGMEFYKEDSLVE